MQKFIVIVLFLIHLTESQLSNFTSINTGKITLISSLPSTYSPATYSLPTSILPAIAPNTTSLQVCISLISFQSIVSIQFSFNTTVLSFNNSQLTISATTIGTTYYSLLAYHYIVSNHPTIQIKRGCYYSSSLLNGTGIRSQNFVSLNTTFTAPLELITVISGVKMSNTLGQKLAVSVVSNTNSLPIINTVVTTQEFCLLEWVCVGLIVFKPMQIQTQIYFRKSSIVNSFINLSGVPYNPVFIISDVKKFFGISTLKMNLQMTQGQKFILQSDNSTDPKQMTTNNNLLQLTVQQFFIWSDVCMLTAGNVYDYSIYDCLTNCSANYYKNNISVCVLCGASPSSYCLTCNGTVCLTCDNTTFRTLVSSVCQCMTGYYDNAGVCALCSTKFSYCTNCPLGTTCINCVAPFQAVGGICQCPAGQYLMLGNCTILIGCQLVTNFSNTIACQSCSTSKLFLKNITSQTCYCQPHTSYNPISGACQGICADGYLIGNICDDNDTNNSNGCANNCTITPGYYCSNPTANQKSICVLISSFTASYLYSTKVINQNSAFMYFSISPLDPALNLMDFSKLIQTSIPNSVIKATYANGIITVIVTYTQSIENTAQTVSINFDPTKIYAPNLTLSINPSGVNYQLIFGPMQKFNNIISLLSSVIGGIAFVFAIVSSVLGYKLIGWQLLMPIQLVYFSFSLLKTPSSSMGSLIGLSFSNGYNRLNSFELSKHLKLTKGLMVLQSWFQFLGNFNFMFGPLIILIIMAIITRKWVQIKKIEPAANQTTKKDKSDPKVKPKQVQGEKPIINNTTETVPTQASRGERLHHFIIDKLLITYLVCLILNCFFSFGLQFITQSLSGNTFSLQLNSAVGLICLFTMLTGLIFIRNKILQKDKHINYHSRNRNYPFNYIFVQIINVILITCLFYTQYGLYIVLTANTLPIFLLIKTRPHGKLLTFDSIIAIICQLLPSISIVIGLISSSMKDLTIWPLISSFIILGLIIILEGLSILRLILAVRKQLMKVKKESENKKAQKQEKAIDQIVQQSIKNQLLSQNGQKMIDWNERNNEDYKSIGGKKSEMQLKKSEQLQSQDDEINEQDELIKLKRRLKRQLIDKRGNN